MKRALVFCLVLVSLLILLGWICIWQKLETVCNEALPKTGTYEDPSKRLLLNEQEPTLDDHARETEDAKIRDMFKNKSTP